MSTKFPVCAILMEMAVHVKKANIKADVQWAPRESNKEADRLANGVFSGCKEANRIFR